jgi:hypothetical protein
MLWRFMLRGLSYCLIKMNSSLLIITTDQSTRFLYCLLSSSSSAEQEVRNWRILLLVKESLARVEASADVAFQCRRVFFRG